MSKTMVELTEDLWVDPEAIVRVAPVERKAGLKPQCRIYFEGATSGVPVDLSVGDVIGKLQDGMMPVPPHLERIHPSKEMQVADMVDIMGLNAQPWVTNAEHMASRFKQAEALYAKGYRLPKGFGL